MSETAWVLGLSLLLFLASEFFFPTSGKEDNKALETKQKHFWSLMLTLLSLVLGFSIKSSYETQKRLSDASQETQKRIDDVGAVFQKLSSKEAQDKFQKMFTEYHKYFDHASPLLRGWATASLDHLDRDMSDGYIPLPREVAAVEIGRVYRSAKDSIVASNVGGTKFYFDNPVYMRMNKDATERGVPIIRFYLFSESQRLLLKGSTEAKTYTIDRFFEEVKMLHKELESVYSVVIDVDRAALSGVNDFLLLDNKFLAKTEISTTDWQPERALATENEKGIGEARTYFHNLLNNINPRYVVEPMSDLEIRKRFHRYEGMKLANEKLATRVFQDVMKSIESIEP